MMMALRPKNNNTISYLFLGSHRGEYFYILPDGRLCSSAEAYFDAPTPIDAETAEKVFTAEQLGSYKISELNFNFVIFMVGLQNKLKAIPSFRPLIPSPQADATILGGKSKIWHQGTISIDNEATYNMEIHRSCNVKSLRIFIDGIYSGLRPTAQVSAKNKIHIKLENEENPDKNLHIFLNKIS